MVSKGSVFTDASEYVKNFNDDMFCCKKLHNVTVEPDVLSSNFTSCRADLLTSWQTVVSMFAKYANSHLLILLSLYAAF